MFVEPAPVPNSAFEVYRCGDHAMIVHDRGDARVHFELDIHATVTLIALLTMVATEIVENKLPDLATRGGAA